MIFSTNIQGDTRYTFNFKAHLNYFTLHGPELIDIDNSDFPK